MAITSIKSPATLNFAGNPIIIEATTGESVSGTGRSFLRIVCEVEVEDETYRGYNLKLELSQPVADKGTSVFNLSEAFQTVIRKRQMDIDMNVGGSNVTAGFDTKVCVRAYVYVYDVYLFDNQEIKSEKVHVMPEQNVQYIYAVPGRLTDFEMLTFPTILPETLSDGKFMSRKPDMGIAYKGETIIVPLVNGSGSMTSRMEVSVGGTTVAMRSDTLSHYSLDYQHLAVDSKNEGVLTVSTTRGGTKQGFYRTNTDGVHFLRFINGFGAIENISVRAKDKLSYEVGGEVHSLVQEASVKPSDRRYATKSQPVGVYELSSGYVPQRWAEWYVQELLTSPRVWIQLGGKWIPALIESEDDCVIYDRTKPEMPHVDFTLRLAIDGVTGVTW
jgi:hypothetical protein